MVTTNVLLSISGVRGFRRLITLSLRLVSVEKRPFVRQPPFSSGQSLRRLTTTTPSTSRPVCVYDLKLEVVGDDNTPHKPRNDVRASTTPTRPVRGQGHRTCPRFPLRPLGYSGQGIHEPTLTNHLGGRQVPGAPSGTDPVISHPCLLLLLFRWPRLRSIRGSRQVLATSDRYRNQRRFGDTCLWRTSRSWSLQGH